MKKYGFYIVILVIYLLFLSKDFFIGLVPVNKVSDFYNNSKDMYYEREYKEISKLLKINNNKYDIEYSKVIMRDIYEFFDKVTILKGSEDGVQKGDLVINHEGLVGVVKRVYKTYSEVELLTNKDINLSVRINKSYGILSSKNNKLYVKNIKTDTEIKEGDKVYTSGLTKTPGSILIGEVKSREKDNLDLEYVIEVNPVTNFYNLNYVGVVTS